MEASPVKYVSAGLFVVVVLQSVALGVCVIWATGEHARANLLAERIELLQEIKIAMERYQAKSEELDTMKAVYCAAYRETLLGLVERLGLDRSIRHPTSVMRAMLEAVDEKMGLTEGMGGPE